MRYNSDTSTHISSAFRVGMECIFMEKYSRLRDPDGKERASGH